MVGEQVGLTGAWNKLLNSECHDENVVSLRDARNALDRAVLAAYGWSDLDPTDTDEILTRLRKLNAERAAEEARGT